MLSRNINHFGQYLDATPPVPRSSTNWNNPTMALSDIERLTLRSPGSVPIMPSDLQSGPVDESTLLSYPDSLVMQPAMHSQDLDAAWNRGSMGRGRGALFMDRDFIHHKRDALHRQLRLASGVGYSNETIEDMFQNEENCVADEPTIQTTVAVELHADINRPNEDTFIPIASKRKNSVETTSEEEEKREESEEESEMLTSSGEWNWVTRTTPPNVTAFRKNIALASLQRLASRKEKTSSAEAKQAPQITLVPKAPHVTVTSVPKEDWRAESKALKEKEKAAWRSTEPEPLLRDLKVDQNWSMFAPNIASKTKDNEDFRSLDNVSESTAETSQPKSESGLDSFYAPQRERKSKSKKNRNVRVLYMLNELPQHAPTAGPPGFLVPTNGIPPMALRNPEYNSMPNRNVHKTFGNLFERSVMDLKFSSKKRDEFVLRSDIEFPQLK